MPQAVMWEELRVEREVSRYCRLLVASEKAGATAAIHAQATALADRLGLTPKSMRMLLWSVAPPAAGEDPSTPLGAMLSAAELRRRRLLGQADGDDQLEGLRARLRPVDNGA